MLGKNKQLPICSECGLEFDTDIEMFKKYHTGDICQNCSRQMFEDEIGYDPN